MLTHEMHLRGLKTLLLTGDSSRSRVQYDHITSKAKPMSAHPFGLRHLTKERPYRYLLLANTGITWNSVETMTIVFRHLIPEICQNMVPGLRIIKICEDRRALVPKSRLIFELEMFHTVHIVGGCNDFSGEGGEGGSRLTALLHTVAEASNTEVQVVQLGVTQEVARKGLTLLDNLF